MAEVAVVTMRTVDPVAIEIDVNFPPLSSHLSFSGPSVMPAPPSFALALLVAVGAGFVLELLAPGVLGLNSDSVHRPWSFVTFVVANTSLISVLTTADGM